MKIIQHSSVMNLDSSDIPNVGEISVRLYDPISMITAGSNGFIDGCGFNSIDYLIYFDSIYEIDEVIRTLVDARRILITSRDDKEGGHINDIR